MPETAQPQEPTQTDDADTPAIDVSSLPPRVQQPIHELAQILRELASDNLKGLVVFGAALTDSFDPTRMRTQSVAVLDHVDLAMLNELRTKGVKFGKMGLQAPLIMTPRYIDQSRDVFPVDLLEIQQRHAVVFGEDHFRDLGFHRPDVRLQCERELKRALIQLRQGLLAAAHRDKVLTDLCQAAAEHVVRILRAVLWLKAKDAPASVREVVDAARPVVDMPLNGLRGAVDLEAGDDFARFEALYRDVEALAEWVDKLEA
ncbi:MAG TPA: hypothetical protein VMZ31_05520 [Phycisphaerae bacterium]|nr:hypothetical protein [Phycisphaerae bacterium]